MQVEIIINGGVSLLLSPENALEEEVLKYLSRQNNEITEIRTSVIVLNKTLRHGVLIAKKPPVKPVVEGSLKNSEETKASEN